MALSKKHYEAFAERFKQQLAEIAENNPECDLSPVQIAAATRTLRRLAAKLALTFKQDNSRFDAVRFLEACGF